MNIRAIHNQILFQFLDKVTVEGYFEEEKTKTGIVILSHFDTSAKTSRWAKIISLGPACSDFLKKEGCEILIENLKWSIGVPFNGERLWKTDEDMLLAYRYPEDRDIPIGA
jgi:co-chaperonin GroES (HSP10)